MMRAALILVALAYWSRWRSGTPPRVAKPSISRSPNQPSAQAIQRIPWRRQTGSKFPTSKSNYQPRLISFAEPMPPADSTLSFQKRLARIVGGNRHDAKSDTKSRCQQRRQDQEGRFRTSQAKAQDPRFQTKAQGQARDQAKTTDSKTVANTNRAKPPWMLSRVGQTRSITSSKH